MNDTVEPLEADAHGELPVLPLRDIVVFPYMIVPLFVGREKSVHALDEVMQSGKKILLLAQKDAEKDDPAAEDLYNIGTVGSILQLLKLPDGTIKVLVEGGARVCVNNIKDDGKTLRADFAPMEEKQEDAREREV
ncbi:LON peptidase substrate-binding domain-containing protein, partial [Pseudomonadota bacterium]